MHVSVLSFIFSPLKIVLDLSFEYFSLIHIPSHLRLLKIIKTLFPLYRLTIDPFSWKMPIQLKTTRIVLLRICYFLVLFLAVVSIISVRFYNDFQKSNISQSLSLSIVSKFPRSGGSFHKLKNTQLHVYSAYADFRYEHMVRLIGFATHEKLSNISCLIFGPGGKEKVPSIIEYLPEGHGMKWVIIFSKWMYMFFFYFWSIIITKN